MDQEAESELNSLRDDEILFQKKGGLDLPMYLEALQNYPKKASVSFDDFHSKQANAITSRNDSGFEAGSRSVGISK